MKQDIRISDDVRDVLAKAVADGVVLRNKTQMSFYISLPPSTPGLSTDGRVVSPILWLELARRQSDRFWSHVDRLGPDECWHWTAGTDQDGYGKFAVGGPRVGDKKQQRHVRAHRLSYELTNGPLAADALLLHSCDVPTCVNPNHLTPGTQADNRADCAAKGRTAKGDRHGSLTRPERVARGERHGSASLTEEQVHAARRLSAAGHKPTAIARMLGSTRAAISGVVRGITWRHVPERAELSAASRGDA